MDGCVWLIICQAYFLADLVGRSYHESRNQVMNASYYETKGRGQANIHILVIAHAFWSLNSPLSSCVYTDYKNESGQGTGSFLQAVFTLGDLGYFHFI